MKIKMEEEDEKFCNNCKRQVSSLNFAIHCVHCERHIFVCTVCDEPVKKSEKDQHLEEYHVISPCDLCEMPMEKWMLPKHKESCPRRLVVCKYCEAEFPFNELSEHVSFCGSRTEKCLLCKKYIMKKDEAQHTEFHLSQKYCKENFEDEIKQNQLSDITCKTAAPEKEISEKSIQNFCKEIKSRTLTKMQKEIDSLIPEGAVGAVASKENKGSKYYGKCHICKEMIPWIDMNTHVPTCATMNGRCSLCSEEVPGPEMKEHMKNHYLNSEKNLPSKVPPKDESHHRSNKYENARNFVAGMDVEEKTVKCPYCFQRCTEDRILDHTRTCTNNVFKCPLCCETVLEKDRLNHESADCRMLKDANEQNSPRVTSHDYFECSMCNEKMPEENSSRHLSFECKSLLNSVGNFYQRDDSNSIYECPLCSQEMLWSHKNTHESFECRVLIENSGVVLPTLGFSSISGSEKHFCCDNCPCMKGSEICVKCRNRIPSNKIVEHAKNCQRLKIPCQHCKAMIESSCEEIHMKYCPKLKKTRDFSDHKPKARLSNQTSSYGVKGAIPKYTSKEDKVNPITAKCGYCRTTLNANILQYHEDECINRPVECSDCMKNVTFKDFHSHKCKKKKGKPETTDKQKNKGTRPLSFTERIVNYFSGTEEKDEDKITERDMPKYSSNHSYNPGDFRDRNTCFSHMPIEEPLLPCEFCDSNFPASELVLHETGCKPELVSYAKTNSSDNAKLKDSSSDETAVTSPRLKNVDGTGMKNSFFAGNNSLSLSSKKEHMKCQQDSKYKPGEFLQVYDKNPPVNYGNNEDGPGKKESGNKKRKKEFSEIQSLWNIKHSDEDLNAQDSKAEQNYDSSDDQRDNDQREPQDLKERNFARENESDEKFSSGDDEEMAAMFNFLKDVKHTDYDQKLKIPSVNSSKIPKNSEINRCSVFDSNLLLTNVQRKHSKELLVPKETTIEEESKIQKEHLRNIQHWEKMKAAPNESATYLRDDENQYFVSSENKYDISNKMKGRTASSPVHLEELSSNIRHLCDYGNKSTTLSTGSSVFHSGLLEKKEEELRKLHEKNIYCLSSNAENYQEGKNVFSQRTTMNATNSKNEKEYDFNNGISKDFKFGILDSSAMCIKDDAPSRKPSEYSEKLSSKCSDKDQEDMSKFKYSMDLKHNPYEFTGCEGMRDYLRRNEEALSEKYPKNSEKLKEVDCEYIDRSLEYGEQLKYQEGKNLYSQRTTMSVTNNKNEKEYDFNNYLSRDFSKFQIHDSPALHNEDEDLSRKPSEYSEKLSSKCTGKDPEYLNKLKYSMDLKHSPYVFTGFEDGKESVRRDMGALTGKYPKNSEKLKKVDHEYIDRNLDNVKQLALKKEFRYEPCESTKLSDDNDNHYAVLTENSGKEREELYKQYTSRCSSEDEKEYLRNFRQHLPDFKFSRKTKFLSSEDSALQTAEIEKKAFNLEPVESPIRESLYATISKKEREIRDLDKKIAELKNRDFAAGTEKSDVAKWKKWRDTESYASSASE